MRRLYLHIGMHKTGSSSIQASLAEGRAAARRFGVDYPDLGPNQSRAFNAVFGASEDVERSGPSDRDAERRRGELAARLTAGPSPSVVVSAEALSHYRDVRAPALAAFLRGLFDDVRVVVYVRDPLAWASSQAQQHIAQGRVTLADLRHPDPNDRRRGRSILPAYRAVVETYIDAFGRDAVDVRSFDPARFVGGGLIADFCHAVGAPDLAAELPEPRRNTAISYESVLLIDRILEQERAGADPERTRSLLATVVRLPGARFVLPADILERVRRETAADLAWLEQTTGRRLFDTEAPIPTGAPAWAPETLDRLVAVLLGPPAAPKGRHGRPGFGARFRRWLRR